MDSIFEELKILKLNRATFTKKEQRHTAAVTFEYAILSNEALTALPMVCMVGNVILLSDGHVVTLSYRYPTYSSLT